MNGVREYTSKLLMSVHLYKEFSFSFDNTPIIAKILYFSAIDMFQLNISWSVGLWCLTPLLTIFQFYHGGHFYWWKKPEYTQKTTDLPQVSVKLYHIMLYQIDIAMKRVRTYNFSGERQ